MVQGNKKPTKKEISERRETARKKRKQDAAVRKAAKPKKGRENPVSVEVLSDGTFAFHGRSVQPTKDKNAALVPFNKVLWNYGIELSAFPDDNKAAKIKQNIGCARFVRNDYLNTRIKLFQEERKAITGNEYKTGKLKELKEANSWLKDADKFALESAIEHVDNAYRNFFDGNAGFPKFASRYKPSGSKYTTKQTNNNIALEQDGRVVFVKLPKIGKIPVALPKGRMLEDILPKGARITSASVSCCKDSYTVSLAIETVIDKPEPVKQYDPRRVISMDMGLKLFCDYSNGNGVYEHVENPRWIKKHEKRLRRFQRTVSRRQYDKEKHRGSKNWRKAQSKVAKEQRKIANQRKDFHHKLSREIVSSCDVFICEDLNIKGLLKNHHLSKDISSVGWGQFLSFIKYKIEHKGGIFLKISRWFPSSKLCDCGYKYDLKLNERYWVCPKCHKFHDRDDHAVDNIRAEGLRILETKGITELKTA